MSSGAEQEWVNRVLATAKVESLAQLEKPVSGTSGARYPLLGRESAQAPVGQKRSWTLRLGLREKFGQEEFTALTEGVDELLWLGQGEIDFPGALTLVEEAESPDGIRRTLKQGERNRTERLCRLDLQVLRNVATLSDPDGGAELLVVSAPEPTADAETESLIEQTLVYLSGILAGADVLEVRQRAGESFDSLWPRLNILRLLKWEAGLSEQPPLCQGAGFFEELRQRLSHTG